MRRTFFAAIVLALLTPVQSAGADIGIVRISPARARPGDRVQITAAGYLGMTHQTFTVVMVPAARAPKPYNCMGGTAFCEPAALPAALNRPPFTIVGTITRWRRVGQPGIHQGKATLTFRLPRVSPGRYVFALFCPSCARGPKGSLIVAKDLVLLVRR